MTTTTPTLESVTTREARLGELRTELQIERDKLTRLEMHLADAYLNEPEKTEDLSQAVTQSKAKIAGLEKAIPRLEEQVAQEKEAAFKGEAERRMLGIARAHGSATTSYEQDVERVKNAAAEYAAAMQRLNQRYFTLVTLAAERLLLVDRFSLEAAPLTHAHAPSEIEAIRDCHGSLFAHTPAPIFRLPSRLLDMRESEALDLRGHVTGTATGRLLEAAGYNAPGDNQTFEQRRTAAMNANRDRADREYRESIAAVDEWLQNQFSSGPVQREMVISAAREAGITVSGAGEASIASARGRLGVVALVCEADKGVWYWGFADELPEGFRVYRDPLRSVPASILNS